MQEFYLQNQDAIKFFIFSGFVSTPWVDLQLLSL